MDEKIDISFIIEHLKKLKSIGYSPHNNDDIILFLSETISEIEMKIKYIDARLRILEEKKEGK